MVMEVFSDERVEFAYLVLSTVHVSATLVAIFVRGVLWIVWKAKVVNSTTSASVMFSTHNTWKETKRGL